jgi:dTMP kinase
MSNGARGKFITVEGSEGVGKSTNIAFITAYLQDQGVVVVSTREPGGTPAAERIREILLDSAQGTISSMTELLLMFAARASHLRDIIQPALARGEWVVCDRFTDASYAYQGGGRGLPDEFIQQLENMVQQSIRPDLTLLLDAPPEVTDQRRDQRGSSDRFEIEDAGFFGRVRAKYLAIAALEPARIKVIDASGDLDAVQKILAIELDSAIANKLE